MCLADWGALEQVSDQIPFGVSLIDTVRRHVFAPMRRGIAEAFAPLGAVAYTRRVGLSRTMPCARNARRTVASLTHTLQRVCARSARYRARLRYAPGLMLATYRRD